MKNKDLIKGKAESGVNLAQDFIDTANNGELNLNGVPNKSGLYNTILNRVPLKYNAPKAATVLEKQGAYIVFGQVPMGATETSGYGAKGLPADSIDLVVGRGAALNRGRGPKKDEVVNNNHMSDAARIYISRLADIDADFNIESDPKQIKAKNPRSGIALKADNVRIIGREGIKIVTGKTFTPHGGEEKNSLGGKINSAPKIDLVAGNNYDNVQGVALGERTVDCFNELNEIVGEIWSAVFNMALIQAGYNGAIGVNVHPWIAGAAVPTTLGMFSKVISSLYQTRTTATMWELNYLKWHGKEYIVSTNVRTN